MTPEQFRSFLKRHDLTQEQFAQMLGCSGRTGQRWAKLGPSPEAETIVKLFGKRPELVAVLKEMDA